jgi:transposase
MLRCAIVAKYKQCKNYSLTARTCKVDISTVKRWVGRWMATGDIKDAKIPGRAQGFAKRYPKLAVHGS